VLQSNIQLYDLEEIGRMRVLKFLRLSNSFRVDDYHALCRTICQSSLNVYTVHEYLSAPHDNYGIILRHDVDYDVEKAIRISRIENEYGIRSTYYIRMNHSVTKDRILQLYTKGNEIGFHIDHWAKAEGNYRIAMERCERDLMWLRSIVPINTVSAHGSSISPFSNDVFIEYYIREKHPELQDAMHGIDFSTVGYYSDAGRSWNVNHNNITDKPALFPIGYSYIHSTTELTDIIGGMTNSSICISSHPELWASNMMLNLFNEFIYGRPRYILKLLIKSLSKRL